MRFLIVKMVWPYSSTYTATALKNSGFILSERSDFYMVVNLSIAFHDLSIITMTQIKNTKPSLQEKCHQTNKHQGSPLESIPKMDKEGSQTNGPKDKKSDDEA